jgi:AraC-like DNA-binding protein
MVDLAPGYRELPAPRALRDVVACFWVRVTATPGEVWIVPDGCSDVVWERGAGTTVVGPDTSAKLVDRAAGDLMVGMRLAPGAGGAVLGVPLDELRDQRVDVADVNRAFAVDAERSPADVLASFASSAAGLAPDPIVAAAARRVAERDIREVARELALSERQLRRRFHAAAGYGPKTLARVLRFRRFVAAVDAGRSDLAALAFEAGYADQSHLSRESTRLAGLPPLALIARRRDGRETGSSPVL